MEEEIQENPLTKEKKGNFPCCSCSGWKIVVCVVLGLLIIAGAVYAGYFLGRKSLSPRELLIPPKPIATQIPIDNGPVEIEVSPTPDITSNWKTYTNTRQNYQISYPPNWILFENTNKAEINGKLVQQDLVTIDSGDSGETPRIEIDSANQFGLTANQIKTKKPSPIKINNFTTYYEGNEDEGGGLFTSFYFEKDDKIYTITTTTYPDDSKNEVNKLHLILSTLKFLD